jgi:surface polysaccharide O-acyltransferase-like enzyme
MLGYYIQDITDYISKKLTLKKHIIIAVIWTILSYIYRFNSAKLYITEEYTVLMKNADYYYDLIEIIQIIIIFSLLLRLQIKESGSLAKVIKFLAPLTTGIFLLHNFVLYYFIETEYFTQTFTIRAIAFVTAITFSLIMSLLINKLPIKLRDALTKI